MVIDRRRMNMIWMVTDSHMIPWEVCGLNFRTFVLQLRENPGRPHPTNWSDWRQNPAPLDETGNMVRDYHDDETIPGTNLAYFCLKFEKNCGRKLSQEIDLTGDWTGLNGWRQLRYPISKWLYSIHSFSLAGLGRVEVGIWERCLCENKVKTHS